jgi:hypothetical protein
VGLGLEHLGPGRRVPADQDVVVPRPDHGLAVRGEDGGPEKVVLSMARRKYSLLGSQNK